MQIISARWLPIVLPAIHVVLFSLTLLTGEKTASNGNPLFCVDLPVSLPMVARDDAATMAVVAVLATAWWYFIGQIGSAGNRGKLSRAGSALGALLIIIICAIDSFAMISQLLLISRQPNFSAADVAIYVLAVALLSGGFVSAVFAAISALGSRKV